MAPGIAGCVAGRRDEPDGSSPCDNAPASEAQVDAEVDFERGLWGRGRRLDLVADLSREGLGDSVGGVNPVEFAADVCEADGGVGMVLEPLVSFSIDAPGFI